MYMDNVLLIITKMDSSAMRFLVRCFCLIFIPSHPSVCLGGLSLIIVIYIFNMTVV